MMRKGLIGWRCMRGACVAHDTREGSTPSAPFRDLPGKRRNTQMVKKTTEVESVASNECNTTLNAKDLRARGYRVKTARQVKLKPGESVAGKYLGLKVKETLDTKTGEMKQMNQYMFENEDGPFVVLGCIQIDEGMAGEEVGVDVVLEYTAQVDTKGGHRMNHYNVFVLSPDDAA